MAAVSAFFAARAIRLHSAWLESFQSPADTALDFAGFAEFVGIAALTLVFIFAANGAYRIPRVGGFGKEFRQIVFLVLAWLLVLVAYFFFSREFFFSRLAFTYAGVLTILFVAAGRLMLRELQKFFWRIGGESARALIVGTNSNSITLAAALERNPRCRFVGFLEVGKLNPKLHARRVVGSLADFEKVVQRQRVTEVILASRKLTSAETRHILAFCRTHHLDFRFIPDLLEVPQKNVDIETVLGIPLISLRPTPLTGWGRVVKRGFDLAVGSSALVLTAPIWLIAAVMIKWDSPGPILFSRDDRGRSIERVGRHGQLFRFWKLRSMRANSDSLRRLKKFAGKNTRAGTPLVKLKNDPRITRVGHFLRRYSIDELPQLLSVLRGQMSLVGPRPHLPDEVAKYQPHHHRVLSIKPGLTGLAQVSGRSDLDFEEEVRLDTWYIENWSIWLDLKIIAKTVGVVLRPRHRE